MNNFDILIVEDDQDTLDLCVEILEGEGFLVMGVGNGAAALTALQDKTPKLVVLDLTLPDMSGAHLLKEISKQGPVFRTLVVSGKDDLAKEARVLGVDAFLRKPYRLEELSKTVKALIG